MKSILAVITPSGWELIEKDEWNNVHTLQWAPDFESLMRQAITGGYLRAPVAIKLGETL